MKYFFVVNSNINAICAKAIILHEKLPAEDVIILTMRGARVRELNLRHVNFIFPHIVDPVPQTRNIFTCRRALKKFDQFIADIIGTDTFYCYVNHNMARNTELLITHPNCTGFSILEEGSAAYHPKEYFEKQFDKRFATIWDMIGYKGRIRRRYFFRPDYDKIYGLTDKAFRGYRDRVILNASFEFTGIDYGKYDNSRILVLAGVVKNGRISMEDYMSGMQKFIASAFNKIDSPIVYYKFHPSQPESERRLISDFFSTQEVRFIRMEDDLVLEELITVAKNLKLYFIYSTIAIYANMLGHRCYSFSDILSEFSSKFKSEVATLNEELKNSAIQIH